MSLKPVITALTDVPEALRGEYEPWDGKYKLKLEGEIPGFVAAAKHAEFRDTNVRLLKSLGADTVEAALQRAGLFTGLDADRLAALKDIDPAEYRALKTKLEQLEKKGVTKPDDVQAQIQAALDGFKTTVVGPLQEKLTTAEKANLAKEQRLNEAAVRSAIGDRFVKAGGKPEAVDFIVDRAKQTFRVVDDKVVAAEGKYGAQGEPLTVEEWISGATKEYAFVFEPSKGGGAAPAGGGSAPRAGVRRLVNPTPEELGALDIVPGKGLCDKAGQPVEIVNQAAS